MWAPVLVCLILFVTYVPPDASQASFVYHQDCLLLWYIYPANLVGSSNLCYSIETPNRLCSRKLVILRQQLFFYPKSEATLAHSVLDMKRNKKHGRFRNRKVVGECR